MGRLSETAVDEKVEKLEQDLVMARAHRDDWKRKHDRVVIKYEELKSKDDILEGVAKASLNPPKWLKPKRPKKKSAVLTAILSDCHFDEVVNPYEIGEENAYDRSIAEMRLEKWAKGLIEQATYYIQNVSLTGVVIFLGGDLVTGDLHDLKETNEAHIPDTLIHWAEQLAAALQLIQASLDVPVHIAVVVGNHGRRTKKPRTKGRVRDNYDWLLSHMVRMHLSSNKKFTWQIEDDPDAFVEIHDTLYLLTHGDQVKGGGGIGGIWPPIMRMLARKRQRYSTDFIAVMGHWHQLIMAPSQGLIVNGSLKGYDEYAAHILNAPPERPQQAAWLTTAENGPTLQFPIFCDDREDEDW